MSNSFFEPCNHPELNELRLVVSDCRKCQLSERRQSVVFGEGNDNSPLMIIGEGPGEMEDKSGRPFVGRSGQLLNRALAENGLSRDDVFIANTVKCRAADWSSGKPKNRAPIEEETTACKGWLLQQIRIIKPKIILCVGSPSAKNLIKKDFKITVERGHLFKSEFACGILATLHPSYILRQSTKSDDGGFSLMVSDISKAWLTAQKLLQENRRTPIES